MALFTKQSDVIAAYMDESMTNERLPITSVAGYVFELASYYTFDDKMKKLLVEYNLAYFRLSECVHTSGEFKQFKNSPEVCLEVEKKIIALIRDYSFLGIACSVSEATFQLMNPIGGHEGVYNALCQWCLWEVGKWADRNGFGGKAAYFFESGHADQSETDRLLCLYPEHEAIRKHCRYSSHTFAAKRDVRGLQAADMFAYFARREAEDHEKDRVGDKARDRRRDFQALIGNTEKELKLIEHRVKHLTPDALREFFKENSFPQTRWYN